MTASIDRTPTEVVQGAAIVAWFEQYQELADLMAEQAEDTEGDPTLDDAVREQLEVCVEMAAQVIPLLGRDVLAKLKGTPTAQPTALASDGTEYVKPPF